MFFILITTLCLAGDNKMLKIHRESERSIFYELKRHGSANDFAKVYHSKVIDKQMTPIEFLKPLTGPTLFYMDTTTNKAVVDTAILSDLTVVSINDFYKQKKHIVGKLLDPNAIKPLDLLKQLIEADVLLTYFHLESNMTIEVIEESPDFLAVVKGSHIYFTNDKNEDDFSFKVRIDKTGTITALED